MFSIIKNKIDENIHKSKQLSTIDLLTTSVTTQMIMNRSHQIASC